MNKKLYVGNLPYSTTDDQLKAVFAEFGEVVSAVIIMDKYRNRSKGFGFVEMSTEEEAKAAMEALNGKEFEGRKLNVNEAKPERRDDNAAPMAA